MKNYLSDMLCSNSDNYVESFKDLIVHSLENSTLTSFPITTHEPSYFTSPRFGAFLFKIGILIYTDHEVQ